LLAPQTGKSKYRFYEASFIPRTMGNEALINAQVVACHTVGRETLLERLPKRKSILLSPPEKLVE